MQLTKSDLQQIGNAVDEKLEKRLDPIERRLGTIEKRLDPIERRLGTIEQGLNPIEKDLKYLKRKVNKMAKTVDLIGRNYDKGDVELSKRVSKIEDHLGLASEN